MSDATKRLEGVIDLRMTDRAEKLLGRMREQFSKMEEKVTQAAGGGRVAREAGESLKGQAAAMQQGADASKEWESTHKRILTTARLTQRVYDRQVRASWELEAQGTKAQQKNQKMLQVHARALSDQERRERGYYALRARAEAENARRTAVTQQAERRYYADRARAEAENTRRKQAQVQAQMRMNGLHQRALRINQQMTEEIRAQAGALGVIGRRLQAQGAMRGGAQGGAMGAVGGFMYTAGRTGKAVSGAMNMVWHFANRMLRVYWIALSMFYAIRNVVQAIGDSTRVVLELGMSVGRVFAGIVAKIVEASTNIERLRARMLVIFGERVKGVLGWVMEEAIGKPFEWTDLAEGVTRAMVMGVKDMRVMQQVVRTAEDMAVAFEQTVERGVQAIMQASSGHFRSMIETFGFRPDLAVRYGAVPLERGGGVAGGLENQATNLAAILRMVNDRVGGAADAMKNTWAGLVSDMADMWYRLVNDVFEPALEPLKAVLSGVRELFVSGEGGGVAPWVTELTETFKRAWLVVEDFAKQLVPKLPDFIAFAIATFAYFTSKFREWYEGNGGMIGILRMLQERFFEWGPRVLDGLGYIGELMGAMAVGVATIATKIAGGAMKAGARRRVEEAGFRPFWHKNIFTGEGDWYFKMKRETYDRFARTTDNPAARKWAWDGTRPGVPSLSVSQWRQSAVDKGVANDPAVKAELERIERMATGFAMAQNDVDSMIDRAIEAQQKIKDASQSLYEASDAIETAWRQARAQGGGTPQFVDILRAYKPEWAEHYERVQKRLGRPLNYEDIVRELPINLESSMTRGADATQQAIEDGFEEGQKKIKNMFDVAKFMGYTSMASKHGFGTQEAMNLAQQRVLQEMGVRQGKVGAGVTPWPWLVGGGRPQQTTQYGRWADPVNSGWVGGTIYPTGDPRAASPYDLARARQSRMDQHSWDAAMGFLPFLPTPQVVPRAPVPTPPRGKGWGPESRGGWGAPKNAPWTDADLFDLPANAAMWGESLFSAFGLSSRRRTVDRGLGAPGATLNVHVQVDTEEGIRATVKSVRLEEQQDAALGWHR